MAVIVDKERAAVESSKNLRSCRGRILAIGEYLGYFQGGRNSRCCVCGGNREIGVNILIGYEESQGIPGAAGAAALIVDDFRYNQVHVFGRVHREAANGNRSESRFVEIGEPIIRGGLERGGLDQASGNKIEFAQAEIVARVKRSAANKEYESRFAGPVRNGILQEATNGQ